MHSEDTTQAPRPLAETSPAMIWVVRIGVTAFTVPFFVVGLGLIFGGPVIGGFGWLGSVFGLPFVAVPGMMLFAIWSPQRRRAMNGPPSGAEAASFASAPPPVPPIAAPIELVACAYCGRPRPATAAKCESCGGH